VKRKIPNTNIQAPEKGQQIPSSRELSRMLRESQVSALRLIAADPDMPLQARVEAERRLRKMALRR
jgi:hypothetical protein